MSDMARTGPRKRRPLLRTLVGRVLRRNRLEQHRTLAEVARDACVSVQYLSEVERGRKEPSSEVLAAVCDSLRIDLSDLLADVGRDLANDRSPVLPLEAVRRRQSVMPPPVLRLDDARRRHSAAPPTPHRPGDVVLLAA